jgi:3-oxoacyl-[acyl-carrier-protein] synthase III
MATVSVRYIVNDVDAAIEFYSQRLGFEEVMHPASTFAMLARGDLRLVLSAPGGGPGGGQAMADGTLPAPGGWNRFVLEVDDLEATVAAVARAGLELDDVDLFVYHQANGRIIRAVGERLDLEPARVADYIAQLGNTSAASIPLTLSLLREDGRLRAGHKVLVAAIGAGFTWGAGVLEWGGPA